jgi:hypothetical protein
MEIKPAGRLRKKGTLSSFGTVENYTAARQHNFI